MNVYAWGQGAFGKLGLGNDSSIYNPTLVSMLDDAGVKHLVTGKTISACIDKDGNLMTWGKPINVLKVKFTLRDCWDTAITTIASTNTLLS